MGEEIRCPDCNNSQIYYRTKKEEYHCVKCGNNFNKKEMKKNVL